MGIEDSQHLKFYKTEDLEQEIDKTLVFEPVEAGEKVERSFVVKNCIDYKVNVSKIVLQDKSESVSIKKSFDSLNPGEVKQVELVFETDLTEMKPLEVGFNIDYSFVIK